MSTSQTEYHTGTAPGDDMCMEGTSKQEQWQWQKEGTSWKGIGIYHVTLTVPSREPLLGTLVIPGNDPAEVRVEPTELGRALLACQRSVSLFHPEIQILQYCLMPDHLHSIWYVRRPMKESIRYVVQGFWRGAKKAGRAYSYRNAGLTGRPMNETADRPMNETADRPMNETADRPMNETADRPMNETADRPMDETADRPMDETADRPMDETADRPMNETADRPMDETALQSWGERAALSSLAPAMSRENPLRMLLGGDTYSRLAPIFTEVPFIRPMSRRGQLQTMIRYVQLNPQRLATKRLKPGFFHVQKGIVIAGRTYAGVGNVALLHAVRYATVHVRHELVDNASRGNIQPLRNYMNGCVLAARQGVVLVSPFISPKEKEVKAVLLDEGHRFIVLADNGFRDYYKPSDNLFDAVAAGRVLILSPWEYDAHKRHISRADCVALNAMAEQIVADML